MTKRIFAYSTFAAVLAGGSASAQSELEKAFSRRPAERTAALRPSAPENAPAELLLKRECGPYLIYVCGYVGDESLKLAVRLAAELRNKHRLRAYIFHKPPETSFVQPTKEQIDEMKKQFKGKTPRFPRLLSQPADNWAVMIGDFKSADDRALEATESKLKKLKPDDFSPEVAVELRWGNPVNRQPKDRLIGLSARPNPLAEKDKQLSREDLAKFKMIKAMNDQEGEHCVYRNRAPLTIRAYTFQGVAGLVENGKKDFLGRAQKVNGLAVAADNARLLCHELRRMGYEAYVFHSDMCSVVCIGGYPGAFPDRIYDPRLLADIQKLKQVSIGPLKLEPDVIATPQDPAPVLNAN